MDQTVFETEVRTQDEWREATVKGYDALNTATDNQSEHTSSFEFVAKRADGALLWKAYAHRGTDMFIARVWDYR